MSAGAEQVEPVGTQPERAPAGVAKQFAQYLRGLAAPPTGLSLERAVVYRRLFFNNVFGLLSQAFPVTSSALNSTKLDPTNLASTNLHSTSLDLNGADSTWRHWVQVFFAQHRCATPLFHQLPNEFLQFVSNQTELSIAPAWIELLQYEYAETVVRLAEDHCPEHQAEGKKLWLSPLALPLAYRYPVHQISPQRLPASEPPAQPTLLLIWRDRAHKVAFQQLDVGAFQLAIAAQSGLARDQIPPSANALVDLWVQQSVCYFGE